MFLPQVWKLTSVGEFEVANLLFVCSQFGGEISCTGVGVIFIVSLESFVDNM